MGKIKGQQVLNEAIKEVKTKIKKAKPKNIIRLPKEVDAKKTTTTLDEGKEHGIIYLGHIPHGFYEEQMRKFFKQFGVVKKIRLIRSKKTGRSRGHAYILFANVSVAKIAAEAMNNYLMCGRLLKAYYIPKERQNINIFYGENYHQKNYPRLHNVKKTLSENHRKVSKVALKEANKKTLKSLSKLEETLKSKGINLKLEITHV